MQTSVDRSVSLHFVPFRSVREKSEPKVKSHSHECFIHNRNTCAPLFLWALSFVAHSTARYNDIVVVVAVAAAFFFISFSTVYKSVQIKANGL